MYKILLISAVLLAVAHAAPDFLSGITAPVAAGAEAIGITSTAATPVMPPTTPPTEPEYQPSDKAPDTAPTKMPKQSNSQGTVEDRTKLVAKLFKDYNKIVNPDNVTLKFGVALIDFHILEDQDAMESFVWLRYVWTDTRLVWDAKDHGDITVLRLPADTVWIPDITLYNSVDPTHMINCWHSNILLYPTGEILWVPPCKMLSDCHLTLKREPYGEQNCGLKFGSWTFDGVVLDMDFYGGNKTMDLSNMQNTSGFEIVSNTAEKHEKTYSCCEEMYPDLTFNLTVKRIPGEELFKRL